MYICLDEYREVWIHLFGKLDKYRLPKAANKPPRTPWNP